VKSFLPKLTKDEAERRQRLWYEMLGECEPEMRAAIQADPTGTDAIGLAIMVEIRAVAEEKPRIRK